MQSLFEEAEKKIATQRNDLRAALFEIEQRGAQLACFEFVVREFLDVCSPKNASDPPEFREKKRASAVVNAQRLLASAR